MHFNIGTKAVVKSSLVFLMEYTHFSYTVLHEQE